MSKNESFLKCKEIEQIRIPIDYKDDFSIDDKNTVLYQHLFDVTDFIHEKIISNKNILLLGYDNTQDLDTIITAYFIRFGKLTIVESIRFLKSKKNMYLNRNVYFFSH